MCGRVKIRGREEGCGQLLGGTGVCADKLCCFVTGYKERDEESNVKVRIGQGWMSML